MEAEKFEVEQILKKRNLKNKVSLTTVVRHYYILSIYY